MSSGLPSNNKRKRKSRPPICPRCAAGNIAQIIDDVYRVGPGIPGEDADVAFSGDGAARERFACAECGTRW